MQYTCCLYKDHISGGLLCQSPAIPLLFYHKQPEYLPISTRAPGGERMSVTATMVAHILLWRPCLSCSRQPARNYDILTLDKYHTAGCESNVFYFLCATLQQIFANALDRRLSPWLPESRLPTSQILWSVRQKTGDKRVHNEETNIWHIVYFRSP